MEDLRAVLSELATEWEKEGKYLDNPWDDAIDRAAGRTYKECAIKLNNVLKQTAPARRSEGC